MPGLEKRLARYPALQPRRVRASVPAAEPRRAAFRPRPPLAAPRPQALARGLHRHRSRRRDLAHHQRQLPPPAPLVRPDQADQPPPDDHRRKSSTPLAIPSSSVSPDRHQALTEPQHLSLNFTLLSRLRAASGPGPRVALPVRDSIPLSGCEKPPEQRALGDPTIGRSPRRACPLGGEACGVPHAFPRQKSETPPGDGRCHCRTRCLGWSVDCATATGRGRHRDGPGPERLPGVRADLPPGER